MVIYKPVSAAKFRQIITVSVLVEKPIFPVLCYHPVAILIFPPGGKCLGGSPFIPEVFFFFSSKYLSLLKVNPSSSITPRLAPNSPKILFFQAGKSCLIHQTYY